MKLNEFLKIMNCYFGIEKSQYDFMRFFFSLFVTEPFSDEELSKDEDDSYYPFSSLCSLDSAKKIFSGSRPFPRTGARFMISHFCRDRFADAVADMSDVVLGNLISDLAKYGITAHLDNISDVVADTFHRFLEAALEERDSIETGTLAVAEIKVQADISTLLLIEANNKCPLCGKFLIRKSKKSKGMVDSVVTQVFPENLDAEKYVKFGKHFKVGSDYNSYENLIALCAECSSDYLSAPTEEEFLNLLKIKKDLQQKQKLQQDMYNMDLETDIEEVVNGLADIRDTGKIVELRMEALKVEKKIEKRNVVLLDIVTHNAVRYYHYIEDLFATVDEKKSGTFSLIASEVRTAYLKFSSNGGDQEEIFHLIEEWMMKYLNLTDTFRIAVGIVVSFFVQNCEVFDEISE